MIFNELSEFTHEFKRLSKKYRSLPDDLKEFKRVITAIPLGNTKHFNVIIKNDRYAIVKARLFCRYLRGTSLRIIYAFHCQSFKVEFIEMYFKGEQQNENRERIKSYLKSLS